MSSFTVFPRTRKKGRNGCLLLKGKFYESAKICSLHFKPENYDPLRPKRLLNSAVLVDSVQLCSCGNNVMACKTPFKCLVSPNAMIPTETDTCSTMSGKEHSYCEKDIHIIQNENIESTTPFKCSASSNETIPTHNTHTENIVVNENEPPAKRRRLKDFNVQCKIKFTAGKVFGKKEKKLQQKVARNEQKIKDLKSLVNIVRFFCKIL
ncbi:hypothetical protein HW555_009418 [Spodoptera exigua]|uniref:THAP-type domain-containing protein n=2 Tax=Spodoptera exigua TaxID=7107 RepID=A0A835GB16_SPOEX|nr:hypothetical protein HW555_009418 [Spodoptera exigua]